jgi:hypothetical protein
MITTGDQRDSVDAAYRRAMGGDLPEPYGLWKTANERLRV